MLPYSPGWSILDGGKKESFLLFFVVAI